MLARLILVLLLAAFTVPAAAASGCHDAAPSRHATHHGAPAEPDKALSSHVCIGCIPPGDWIGARLTARAVRPAMPLIVARQAFAAGLVTPPALPPPRAA